MDERKEGCEKESSPGSSGNFDKFKWMEILLAFFFLRVKAYVFGDVLHAETVVQQERPTSEMRWTRRSSSTTSSSSTKRLFSSLILLQSSAAKVKVNLSTFQTVSLKQVSAWIRTAYFYIAVCVWFEEWELLVDLGPEGHVGYRYRRTTVLICLACLCSPLKQYCTLNQATYLCYQVYLYKDYIFLYTFYTSLYFL